MFIGLLWFKLMLRVSGNNIGKNIVCNGLMNLRFHKTASIAIGDNVRFNNTFSSNPISSQMKSSIFVGKSAELVIGYGSGFSGVNIYCKRRIVIGDFVKVGAGVKIYDTDFHSLNPTDRKDKVLDSENTRTKHIVIGDNVFIGTMSVILKGVSIGKNAVIGAGSIVTTDIPENEIWAGSPARFIRGI